MNKKLKYLLIIFLIAILNICLFCPISNSNTAKDEIINIAFNIDKNYPIYTMLTINSIVKNSNSKFEFYIIENNLTDTQKTLMNFFVKKFYKQNITFIHFDNPIINKNKRIYLEKNITNIAIARIMLPQIVKNVDKIIYLDSDILVNTDIKALWDVDLNKHHTGMVQDIVQYKIEGTEIKNHYMNSGVMVIDAKQWREKRISQKLLNLFNKSKNFQYYFVDQDIINIVLNGEIKEIPIKWNNQMYKSKMLYQKNDCIYHFTGHNKPWLFMTNSKQEKLYTRYWNHSPLIIFKPYYINNYIIKSKKKHIYKLTNIGGYKNGQ